MLKDTRKRAQRTTTGLGRVEVFVSLGEVNFSGPGCGEPEGTGPREKENWKSKQTTWCRLSGRESREMKWDLDRHEGQSRVKDTPAYPGEECRREGEIHNAGQKGGLCKSSHCLNNPCVIPAFIYNISLI